jgi:hypothetical protein
MASKIIRPRSVAARNTALQSVPGDRSSVRVVESPCRHLWRHGVYSSIEMRNDPAHLDRPLRVISTLRMCDQEFGDAL